MIELARRAAAPSAFLLVLLGSSPAAAQTDLLIVPFVGAKFHGSTTIFGGETVGESKLTFGLSTLVLSEKFLGVEGDIDQTPQFFGHGVRQTVTSSALTTLTGNVIIAVPKAITQESLRPYLVSGLGLIHARVTTTAGVLDTRANLLGLDIGGGAIGFVSPRAGARFELRHFKTLTNDARAVTIGGTTRLSFWRLTAGLVLRY